MKIANIVVVDDEPLITLLLKATLVGHGYSVRATNDFKEATQLMNVVGPVSDTDSRQETEVQNVSRCGARC